MIKAITFVITALINVGVGGMLFFMLVISLNGFTEKQAAPGLILFIVWILLTAIITGTLGFLCAGYLIDKKSFNSALAVLAAIVVFVLVGAASEVVGFFAAVFLASAMH